MSASPTAGTRLEPALLYALLERGGIEPDGEGWRAPDGRRTVTVGDALIWALERIAGDAVAAVSGSRRTLSRRSR